MKGVYGQSRPKNPRMNALTRLPSTKINKNAKGDPLRCYSSHQMDQHVLDIQRNVLFLQILHPDRGIPRHKAARRLPRIPGRGKSLPTDFIKPPSTRPQVRLVRQDPLGGGVVVLTLVVRVHIAGRELEGDGTSAGVWCSGTKLGMVAVQDLVIPHTNRIHILPDLPHDYPRHIPRCLPMPGQDILVVRLHPYSVLESILLDFSLLELLGPLLMLVLKCFAHLGRRVVRLSHHSVRIPGHFAMVQPWESA